jgi:hypothetical protein
MKFNWGTGIVIFIILFVSGMGVMVYISVKQDINLVHEDYYPKGIAHEEMIQKARNTYALDGEMKVTFTSEIIEIAFPMDFRYNEVAGNIVFYRPSSHNDDKVYEIQLTDSGIQTFSTEGMKKGKYVVQIEWEHEGTNYYFEKAIHVE